MYTLWKLDSFPSDFHSINDMQTIPLRPVNYGVQMQKNLEI